MAEIKELAPINAQPAMRMALNRHEKATAYAEIFNGDDHVWTASENLTVKMIGKCCVSVPTALQDAASVWHTVRTSRPAMLAFASFAAPMRGAVVLKRKREAARGARLGCVGTRLLRGLASAMGARASIGE
jgi:hypothetical protein